MVTVLPRPGESHSMPPRKPRTIGSPGQSEAAGALAPSLAPGGRCRTSPEARSTAKVAPERVRKRLHLQPRSATRATGEQQAPQQAAARPSRPRGGHAQRAGRDARAALALQHPGEGVLLVIEEAPHASGADARREGGRAHVQAPAGAAQRPQRPRLLELGQQALHQHLLRQVRQRQRPPRVLVPRAAAAVAVAVASPPQDRREGPLVRARRP
eukprot:scaffold6678_cov336-Prasinococcus_capsulatus_cf.AAC.5